jgi:hypothetical protein
MGQILEHDFTCKWCKKTITVLSIFGQLSHELFCIARLELDKQKEVQHGK